MQLITLLSTASAMIATASARSAVTLNEECDLNAAYARVINRCDYDVYLWSVYKGDGCPTDGMVTLKSGETYAENYANTTDATGVSIKISKTEVCKENDIVQLEYYIETSQPGFNYNYLDVSYVDCGSDDCPTRDEGYYLVAGSQTGTATAGADNTWCPILSCNDPATCNLISYVLPDDVQTKTCDSDQSMDFYMCGGDAPSGDNYSGSDSSSAASSSEEVESSTAAPTSTSTSASDDNSYNTLDLEINVAAVTSAPTTTATSTFDQKTKTQVVYVTAYEYVNAKRHAHDHARRHFHA